MARKLLTKKEKCVIDKIIEGTAPIDSVLGCYDCSSRNSARVVLSGLFKKELFNTKLLFRQNELSERRLSKNLKFIELLEKYAPPHLIAQKIAENIFSKDRRVSDSSIDKYLKIRGEYAPAKLGIYRDFDREVSKVLTTADLKKLVEKRAKELVEAKELKQLKEGSKEAEWKEIKEAGKKEKVKEEKAK